MRKKLRLTYTDRSLLFLNLSLSMILEVAVKSRATFTGLYPIFFEKLHLYIYRYKKLQQELEHIVQFIPIYRTGYKNHPSVIKMKVPLLE